MTVKAAEYFARHKPRTKRDFIHYLPDPCPTDGRAGWLRAVSSWNFRRIGLFWRHTKKAAARNPALDRACVVATGYG